MRPRSLIYKAEFRFTDVLNLFHPNLQDQFERAAVSTINFAMFAVRSNSAFDLERDGCAVRQPMSVSAATMTAK